MLCSQFDGSTSIFTSNAEMDNMVRFDLLLIDL